jgi:hypothetical protein
MTHLSTEQLIDCLEATGAPRREPHLEECAACRARLVELRATVTAIEDVEVPEPSAEFWREWSGHVRDAIDAHARRPGRWTRWLGPGPGWWRWGVAGGALAAAVLAIVIARGTPVPPGKGAAGQTVAAVGPAGVAPAPSDTAAAAVDDDPQMALVVDLASGFDWDDFTEAGLAPQAGAVDGALDGLTEAERTALQRLLADAMTRSGA